jgi:hypothetical protein
MPQPTPDPPPRGARPPGGPTPRANPAQLEGDIDAGRTGDKSPGEDPAAAPLGTDEEAAGPMLSERDQAEVRGLQRQGRPKVHEPNAAEPELAPAGEQPRQAGGFVAAAIVGVLIAVALAIVIYLAM